MAFQFTPLREGRRPCASANTNRFPFQFTPLREGRHEERHAGTDAQNFNSRPSARGDPMPMWFSSVSMNFNSRPSARGDMGESGGIAEPPISIHAPPRGATAHAPSLFVAENISIHAPPRGATLCGTSRVRAVIHFNSRPSARGDCCPCS